MCEVGLKPAVYQELLDECLGSSSETNINLDLRIRKYLEKLSADQKIAHQIKTYSEKLSLIKSRKLENFNQ